MIWLISTCKVFHNKTGSQETTYSNRFQPLPKHTCILSIALFSHSIIELNSVLFFSFIQALIDKTNNLKSYSWIFVKSTPYNHWMLTQNDSKNTHQHQWKTILNQNRLSPSQTLFFFFFSWMTGELENGCELTYYNVHRASSEQHSYREVASVVPTFLATFLYILY